MTAEPPQDDAQREGFSLPLPDSEPDPGLRRSLFGARAEDVRVQLEARKADFDELRRDVAALWLAFGQHERAIRDLIAAAEALGGVRSRSPSESASAPQPADGPPGDSAEEVVPADPQEPPPPPGVPADVIAAQLSGLDDVLSAIEQATRSLERTYADEIGDTGEERAGPEP
jgi:hypothetical protein